MPNLTPQDLHSHDQRPAKDIKKLDSDGNYTSFDGLTIVMALNPDDMKLGEKLYKDLEKIIPRKAHSLLPYQSYHVTLCGIACRNHFENCQDYNKFIDENYENLKKLQQELDKLVVGGGGENSQSSIAYRIDTVSMKKSSLSKLTGYLKVRNSESEKLLNACFEKCKELNLDLRMSEPHLSLAYPTPKGKKLNAEERKLAQQVLNEHLDSTCTLFFERPRICLFRDMCEFKPIFE